MAKNRFLWSVLTQSDTVTASTVVTYDLPVNPLSFIALTITALNNTGTITNYQLLAGFLKLVSNIAVLYKGQAIISGSLSDVCILNYFLNGMQPNMLNPEKTDDDVRTVTVPICFARNPYDVNECLFATRKGELQLQITYSAGTTGIDGVAMQIETLELLDAQPQSFCKYTTLSRTPTATGFSDLDLPIGNDHLGYLLFGTTIPSSTSLNSTIGQVKLLLDNVEYDYSL